MRLTWKDAGATLLVAAAVAVSVPFLTGAEVPLMAGARPLAAAVFGLGVAACIVNGIGMSIAQLDRVADGWARGLAWLATLAFVALIATLISGDRIALGVLVGTVVLMWLLTSVRHAVVGRSTGGAATADNRDSPTTNVHQ